MTFLIKYPYQKREWKKHIYHLTWIIQSMPACSVASVMSDSLRPRGLQPTSLLCPWDSTGKKTGVGSHALLQGILPTQGQNLSILRLLHCQFFTTSATWEAQIQSIISYKNHLSIFSQMQIMVFSKGDHILDVKIQFTCYKIHQFLVYSQSCATVTTR